MLPRHKHSQPSAVTKPADQFIALKSRNVDDYVDAGILDSLKSGGFLAEMERKYAKR